MILFLIFLSENQRQGPEDRPISTSFYLLKFKDFKGGPLKQNPWPLILVHFCRKVNLSLACGSWQLELRVPSLAGKLHRLEPALCSVNRLHLGRVQELGSLRKLSSCYCPCERNGHFFPLDCYNTYPGLQHQCHQLGMPSWASTFTLLDNMLPCLPMYAIHLCFNTCRLLWSSATPWFDCKLGLIHILFISALLAPSTVPDTGGTFSNGIFFNN